jgi:hypothetical protein
MPPIAHRARGLRSIGRQAHTEHVGCASWASREADLLQHDDKWASLERERPDEIAIIEVDKVKDKSIKRDIPFALRRGTIGQVTNQHALDAAQRAAEDERVLHTPDNVAQRQRARQTTRKRRYD